MKRFLKFMCLVLCVTCIVSLVACNGSNNQTGGAEPVEPVSEQGLYDSGVVITSVVGEMVNSETFVGLMSLPSQSVEMVKASDYNAPINAYKITPPSFQTMLELMEGEQLIEGLSSNLLEQMEGRYDINYILTTLTNAYGSHALIARSSFMAKKVFDGALSETVVYLYLFETGKPIAVVFTPFGEKQFTANGGFVFGEFSSLTEVESMFVPFGCQVEKIK